MTEKIQGSVKWFSNKKGYGFVTPNEGSTVTDDIFVHQSAIHSDGYRTLVRFHSHFHCKNIRALVHILTKDCKSLIIDLVSAPRVTCSYISYFLDQIHAFIFIYAQQITFRKDENWQVEFEIGTDEDGKPKAENVTAVGGGPCTGPRKARMQNRRTRRVPRDGEDAVDAPNGGTGRKEPQPVWHDVLSDEVKQALQDKDIRTSTGTIDISLGNARIKMGTRGYASIATEDMILGEGSFECDSDGNATFEWKRAIRFTDVWNTYLDTTALVQSANLKEGK